MSVLIIRIRLRILICQQIKPEDGALGYTYSFAHLFDNIANRTVNLSHEVTEEILVFIVELFEGVQCVEVVDRIVFDRGHRDSSIRLRDITLQISVFRDLAGRASGSKRKLSGLC